MCLTKVARLVRQLKAGTRVQRKAMWQVEAPAKDSLEPVTLDLADLLQ